MSERTLRHPPLLAGSYLVIELSNQCNLACVHCAVSSEQHPHHIQTGHLSLKHLEVLLDDLQHSHIRFDTLILFWLGEPTLHPYFTTAYRMVLRASVRHGTFQNIELHTNAIRLREGLIQTLINQAEVRQTLHITIDAAHASTYHAVKGRDQLDRVNANTVGFLQQKLERKARWPRTVLQYIVGSNNVGEVGDFISNWTTFFKGNNISFLLSGGQVPSGSETVLFFRQLDCPTPEMQAAENIVFEDCMKQHGIPMPQAPAQKIDNCSTTMAPCSGFWKSPVVYWDGRVTLCTRDNALDNVIGSIADEPFSKMWWGEQLQRRRLAVAEGDYRELPLCQTCFIPKSLNHTDILPSEINAMQAYVEHIEGCHD